MVVVLRVAEAGMDGLRVGLWLVDGVGPLIWLWVAAVGAQLAAASSVGVRWQELWTASGALQVLTSWAAAEW